MSTPAGSGAAEPGTSSGSAAASTSGAGPRPAPQYGEYATPEQQRESILRGGGTLPEPEPAAEAAPVVTSAPVPVGAPPPTAPSGVGGRGAGGAGGAGAPRVPGAPVDPAVRAATVRRTDRFVTIALLVYGLWTVVTTIPQLLDVAGFADTWMQMAGIDAEFTNYDQGVLWGRIAAFVFAVGWLLTTLICWRVISRGHRAWWIPLVGAVLSFLLVSLCLTVPIMGDPALVAGIMGR
ncbi:DUF6264 family protein [Microbacterium sp. W1N]|uniref:DUF6264 family protein n=1 Tax=Microbacterium festucae TaxID=2977531 RepID=UPI0021BE0857|nr:DUF6264 family protein [Microbacterium festucae]MCT9820529.1 DUF6264 family protein [Microbacterium festucae]